jgi:2-polyprenyl-3-methyl-5-hydroxy-6-metoxy-1,4-benzoquinol methylase
MLEYEKLNENHRGPILDPCVEYTAKQALKISNIESNSMILDYGCSVGRAASIFASCGHKVIGVDVVEKNLKKANEHCFETHLRINQSEKMPFNHNSFDLIFSSQVIEHLHRRDGYDFIEEAFNLLKPNGKIFITTPNPHYLRILLNRSPMIRGNHLSSWIIEEMHNHYKDVGFSKIKWFGNGQFALYFGDKIPFRWFYGGYALIGVKPS